MEHIWQEQVLTSHFRILNRKLQMNLALQQWQIWPGKNYNYTRLYPFISAYTRFYPLMPAYSIPAYTRIYAIIPIILNYTQFYLIIVNYT